MTQTKPSTKPANSNFSSGPCAKRPGWNINLLKNSPVGRSHRSKECKNKLKEAIDTVSYTHLTLPTILLV